MCDIKNDPGLMVSDITSMKKPLKVMVRKSEVNTSATTEPRCPIHKANHLLQKCLTFIGMSYQKKREFLRSKGICFKCCKGKHFMRFCKENVICEHCGSKNHITCMHKEDSHIEHGGECPPKILKKPEINNVNAKCTQLCGRDFSGRSCGKIVLVNVFPLEKSDSIIRTYALIDDQSNKTLAHSKFFDMFGLTGDSSLFTVSSCSGTVSYHGRVASDFCVEPVSGDSSLTLPKMIECDEIPNNRHKIPTPEVALAYLHISDIAPFIPELDPSSEILLMIGRDVIPAHYVLEQRTGPPNLPFAQKLYLGWTIIGEVCLGDVHKPDEVIFRKTNILSNGRRTHFEPCNAKLCTSELIHSDCLYKDVPSSVFKTTDKDEKPGLSIEDREFLEIMENEMYRDSTGKWTAPLPFRAERSTLPNNQSQALRRAFILDKSLQKNETKMKHAIEFMDNIFKRGHAEAAPSLSTDKECWYLPVFGVYHPQKPNKIRMVFDSSAKFCDVSLNSVLLSGPDLTNSLIGVLMRFRLERVAVIADIETMFYGFSVSPMHRDYLRFYWYKDNDPKKHLTEHRMTVHVFGNSLSPAIATYGLRRAAFEAESIYGSDVKKFVDKNFSVDDGLISLPTTEQAVDLLRRTQQALRTYGNLRLHKIAFNEPSVMNEFDSEDLAKDLLDVDIRCENLPDQRNLGLVWHLQSDTFGFQIISQEKPFTRRGVLSCINSLFDPLGFLAPVTIKGKLLLREMMSGPVIDWDDPLPCEILDRWTEWKRSLLQPENLKINRRYLPGSQSQNRGVVVFTDASESAIAAVAYLCDIDLDGALCLGFIMGKAKVAPKQTVSIPRLELCAAVLGVEIATIIRDQLDVPPEDFRFFTDSMIVLGYIHNKKRRFLTYVSNRVHRIHNFCFSGINWNFVPTEENPADHGTRAVLNNSFNHRWLHGPHHWLQTKENSQPQKFFDLVDPASDKEIKQEIISVKTEVKLSLGTARFSRFSSWKTLVKTIMFLKLCCRRRSTNTKTNTVNSDLVSAYKDSENFLIRQVQNEIFPKDIEALHEGKPLPRDSHISKLNPIIDDQGIICVGGRLRHADINLCEKNPILLPGNHYVTKLFVLYHHQLVHHQGRHITEGSIRTAGFWITGCKRLVYSVISNCVRCKRMRGSLETQKMADLPSVRLTQSPPFTYVGVDCFGSWEVTTRKTRGGSANSKRWAVIFVCMCSRAVHFEVLEQMSTSSFINSLRRFYAIRGPVKEFFSDRGTNFVGCVRELGYEGINVEDTPIKHELQDHGTIWRYNTPYSSHMGGAWERLIGITRRILASMLFDVRHSKLTHEVIITFLAEVSAIMNNRPLAPVYSNPESPCIMTPQNLLTQKIGDLSETSMNFSVKDLYTSQWKAVQVLADRFWSCWRKDYLQTLQQRRKWKNQRPNIKVNDIVLLKDDEQHRNHWPLGRVSRVFPSNDKVVRKIEVCTAVDGIERSFVRPITQIVLLVSAV